jgi:hypothetical protein
VESFEKRDKDVKRKKSIEKIWVYGKEKKERMKEKKKKKKEE